MTTTFKNAFVTGASSGLGRGLALALAKQGIHVAVSARREKDLETLRDEILAAGGRCDVHVLDVTNPTQTERTLQDADTAMGGIDLVVANAGVGANKWSGQLQYADTAGIIAANVIGATATLTALIPRMVERKSGHLVGVSSLAQYRGLPKSAAYSASKAFLSTFLEGVRVDLLGTGVTVSDIRPGFVRTPLTAKNAHNMPFLMELDDAAEIMCRGILAKQQIIAFPWQMASAARALPFLPNFVYDRAIGKVRGDGK